jgi:carbonic anhydrase
LIAQNDPASPGGPFKEGALAWAEAIAYQPFTGKPGDSERDKIERSVKQDVLYLKSHPLIKASIKLTGYVYDLHSGRVEEVD